ASGSFWPLPGCWAAPSVASAAQPNRTRAAPPRNSRDCFMGCISVDKGETIACPFSGSAEPRFAWPVCCNAWFSVLIINVTACRALRRRWTTYLIPCIGQPELSGTEQAFKLQVHDDCFKRSAGGIAAIQHCLPNTCVADRLALQP